MPALSKAKQQAQKAKCLSNLHQIGLGLKMYADDNSETFPPGSAEQFDPKATPDYNHTIALGGIDGSGVDGYQVASATNRLLNAYVPAREAWSCPADRGLFDRKPTEFAAVGNSYRFNREPA